MLESDDDDSDMERAAKSIFESVADVSARPTDDDELAHDNDKQHGGNQAVLFKESKVKPQRQRRARCAVGCASIGGDFGSRN